MTTTAEVLRQDRWAVLVIVRNGRCAAADFIDALPLRSQKKLLRRIERVAASENGSFDLKDEQKFKRLEEGLFELKSDQVRLLMFVDSPHRAVITHGFLKKTRQTPPVEVARGRMLRDEYRREQ